MLKKYSVKKFKGILYVVEVMINKQTWNPLIDYIFLRKDEAVEIKKELSQTFNNKYRITKYKRETV